MSNEVTTNQNADHIVYITRASLKNMRVISHQIQVGIKCGNRSQNHIYYVPFHNVICEQILEDENVLPYVTYIGELNIGLIPLDSDILSLEVIDLFKQCYVDGDTSSLNMIAHSIHKLQNLFGIITNIKSKGAGSKKVLQKLLQLRKSQHTSQSMQQNQNNAGQNP